MHCLLSRRLRVTASLGIYLPALSCFQRKSFPHLEFENESRIVLRAKDVPSLRAAFRLDHKRVHLLPNVVLHTDTRTSCIATKRKASRPPNQTPKATRSPSSLDPALLWISRTAKIAVVAEQQPLSPCGSKQRQGVTRTDRSARQREIQKHRHTSTLW